MQPELTAERFVKALEKHRSTEEQQKIQRYFKTGEGEYGAGDEFMGVRMGSVFETAKTFIDMPPDQIEMLLESPIHEVRAGALSIMSKQAAHKKTSEMRRKNCTIFTCDVMTASTTGIWSISPRGMSSAAIWPINRAMCCIHWQGQMCSGSGERPF